VPAEILIHTALKRRRPPARLDCAPAQIERISPSVLVARSVAVNSKKLARDSRELARVALRARLGAALLHPLARTHKHATTVSQEERLVCWLRFPFVSRVCMYVHARRRRRRLSRSLARSLAYARARAATVCMHWLRKNSGVCETADPHTAGSKDPGAGTTYTRSSVCAPRTCTCVLAPAWRQRECAPLLERVPLPSSGACAQ